MVFALPQILIKATTIFTVHLGLPCLAILMAATLAPGLKKDEPSLIHRGGFFIIRENGVREDVPLKKEAIPRPPSVIYRKDANYAVWDSRGLTIRKDGRVRNTRLPDIALTPKLFSRDEILQTKDLLQNKKRQKGADALSGSMRVGNGV